MKAISLKTSLFYLITSLLLSIFIFSCSKNDDMDPGNQTYTTSGSASGSQVSPPVTTSGTATHTGTYNAQTNVWQYSVNWSSLSSAATIVELHGPADVGVNGNLLFALTITAGGVNGTASGSAVLTDEQEVQLLQGKLYYTILTATHVTGEIRGQITASAQ